MNSLKTELERLHGRFPDATPDEWLHAVLESLHAYHAAVDVHDALDGVAVASNAERVKVAMLAQLGNL